MGPLWTTVEYAIVAKGCAAHPTIKTIGMTALAAWIAHDLVTRTELQIYYRIKDMFKNQAISPEERGSPIWRASELRIIYALSENSTRAEWTSFGIDDIGAASEKYFRSRDTRRIAAKILDAQQSRGDEFIKLIMKSPLSDQQEYAREKELYCDIKSGAFAREVERLRENSSSSDSSDSEDSSSSASDSASDFEPLDKASNVSEEYDDADIACYFEDPPLPTRAKPATAEIAPPEIPLPEIAPPEIPLPEIAPPEIPLPEIAPPEIPLPEIAPPEIAPPEIVPEIALPEIVPEIAPPEIPPPEIAPPEIAPRAEKRKRDLDETVFEGSDVPIQARAVCPNRACRAAFFFPTFAAIVRCRACGTEYDSSGLKVVD